MGFLDKAKKLAEQAKDKAEEALAEVKARQSSGDQGSSGGVPSTPAATDPRMGTPYVPGMLGRPGWRERNLPDPAAVLPIDDRDRVGVPHSTKSQVVAEPYGVGRRWLADGRSAALFYQLDSEHQAWEPPGERAGFPAVGGASAATLPDGRTLVFLSAGGRHAVLEVGGLDEAATAALAQRVAEKLTSE